MLTREFKDFSIKDFSIETVIDGRVLKLELTPKSDRKFDFYANDRSYFDGAVFIVESAGFKYNVEILFFRSENLFDVHQKHIELYIKRIIREDADSFCGKINFTLFNVGEQICENGINHPDGSWSLSRLNFQVNNEEWNLIDTDFKNKDRNIYTPLKNGKLSTANAMGYTSAKTVMDYICRVLSFATQKDVVCFESYDERETLIETFSITALPYGRKKGNIFDLWCDGSLPHLLASAYIEYTSDEQWWRITLAYFQEILFAHGNESKMILSAVLLERITRKFSTPVEDVIDSDFASKIEEIGKDIHPFLSKLDNWSHERTKSLIGVISSWNTEQSFAKKIESLEKNLNIPKALSDTVKIRGSLMHSGEFPSKMNAQNTYESFLAINTYILFVILRKFNYLGQFKHDYFSGTKISLKEVSKNNCISDFKKIDLR